MTGLIEWAIFFVLAGVAVAMAAGMLLTMSMYRAGLALMSSFVALAGLFILLDADLLATIQVMMNVGGMLVMVLFMVMIMPDPGGEMMWEMKRTMHLPGPGALSMRMPKGPPPPPEEAPRPAATTSYTCPMHPEVRQEQPGSCPICGMNLIPVEMAGHGESVAGYTCPMHPEVQLPGPGTCPRCGMPLIPAEAAPSGHHPAVGAHREHAVAPRLTPQQYYQMLVEMAMSTAQRPWAIALGVTSTVLLGALVLGTPWPRAAGVPGADAVRSVGELLLSRYMIGFEGAAFLILAGIAGAVILGKREPGISLRPARVPAARPAAIYTCPMHPEIRQPGPGECPICGMALIPVEQAAHAGHHGHGEMR